MSGRPDDCAEERLEAIHCPIIRGRRDETGQGMCEAYFRTDKFTVIKIFSQKVLTGRGKVGIIFMLATAA